MTEQNTPWRLLPEKYSTENSLLVFQFFGQQRDPEVKHRDRQWNRFEPTDHARDGRKIPENDKGAERRPRRGIKLVKNRRYELIPEAEGGKEEKEEDIDFNCHDISEMNSNKLINASPKDELSLHADGGNNNGEIIMTIPENYIEIYYPLSVKSKQ